MGVSKNNCTPKSSILIGFSIINHPSWGTPIFGNTYIPYIYIGDASSLARLHGNIRPVEGPQCPVSHGCNRPTVLQVQPGLRCETTTVGATFMEWDSFVFSFSCLNLMLGDGRLSNKRNRGVECLLCFFWGGWQLIVDVMFQDLYKTSVLNMV